MFDELDNKTMNNANTGKPTLSGGGPVEPSSVPTPAGPGKATEDIFANVDDLSKPDIFKAKPSTPPAKDLSQPISESSGQGKKFLVLGSIIVGLVVIFVGGYMAYARFFRANLANNVAPTGQELTPTAETPAAVTPEQAQNPASQTEGNVPAPAINDMTTQAVDSDQDGLTDQEEISLGTNPNSPDSDNDGLFDREEVKVYGTDPLNPDTDGDGYKDGDEVKNGYNPRGPGKLYEINQNSKQ